MDVWCIEKKYIAAILPEHYLIGSSGRVVTVEAQILYTRRANVKVSPGSGGGGKALFSHSGKLLGHWPFQNIIPPLSNKFIPTGDLNS